MKFVSILIFSILFSPSFAQNSVVFQEEKNETFLFNYKEEAAQNEIISNYFVTELAKSIPKILKYTEYTFSSTVNLKIEKLSNNQNNYQTVISLKNFKCKGDVKYKSFDISELLLPNELSFKIVVSSGDNQNIASQEFTNLIINKESGNLLQFNFTDSLSNQNYKLELLDLKPDYTEAAKQNFDKKVELIDNYFLTDMAIGKGFEKLQMINPQNVDMIPLYDSQLKDVEKIVKDIKAGNFDKQLDLKSYDPINYTKNIDSLENKTIETRTTLNQFLVSLDNVYYNKGNEYLEIDSTKLAVVYFDKSLKVNPFFTPSYYKKAKIHLNNGELNSAADIVTNVLNNMKPDHQTHTSLLQLAENIYNTYVSKGEELNQKEKFNESIELLTYGRKFCSTTTGIVCTDEIHKGIARGHYGLYSSYLRVAQRALNAEKLEMAESYINEAKKYQQQNSEDIINDSEVNTMFTQLMNSYVNLGKSENTSKNYENALRYFENALNLCNSSEFIECSYDLTYGVATSKKGIYDILISKATERNRLNDPYNAEKYMKEAEEYQKANSDIITSFGTDTIKGKIKYQLYKEYIIYGEQSIGYRNFQYAFDQLKKAKELEQEYVFQRNPKLDTLLSIAAKPVIINNLKTGRLKAWGNDIEASRKIYNQALEDQKTYNIENDAEINSAMSELKDKIFDQECINVQLDCDNNYRKAIQNANMLDFITADEFLKKAISIAEENKSCQVILTSVESLKSKYVTAVAYQKLLNESNDALAAENFSETILNFEKAEKYYDDFNIQEFRLAKPSLFQFVLTQNNNSFSAWCADYFIKKNELSNSLTLLKTLKKRNYPIGDSKNIQEKLASKLALIDKKDNPDSNPKGNIVGYVGIDKWFKYFKAAYLKSWKKA